MAIYEIDVQDFLPLGHTEESIPDIENLVHWLSLSQDAHTQFNNCVVGHLFNPQEVVTVTRPIRHQSLQDFLFMYDRGAPLAGGIEIIDVFFMWQSARPIAYDTPVHGLILTQGVEVVKGKHASSTIVFVGMATCNSVRPRTTSDDFGPQSSSSVYMDKKYWSSITFPTLTGPNAPEC